MKKLVFILSILVFLGVSVSCESSAEKERRKTVELMSTQTLGLAYLEEMKLEEAEREFKKFIELAPDEKLGYANLGLVYLRMGNYDEAERLLTRAKGLDEDDPEVNLLLATVYRMKGSQEKAIEVLEQTVVKNPDHPKVLFELCELYAGETEQQSSLKRQEYLVRLKDQSEGNLVPLILLTDSYIKNGEADAALEQLEQLPALFPEFPEESMPYYDKALASLQAGDAEGAMIPFTVFHNYQKVTYPYQSGMQKLKGPVEAALGIPLINYSDQTAFSDDMGESILEVIKFTEVSVSAGLNIPAMTDAQAAGEVWVHHTVGDFDGDGDTDLYIGYPDESPGGARGHLFQNELGRYRDVSEPFGISHDGSERSASFGDFDNDGFLDLYVILEQGALLYHNAGMGNFVNKAEEAGITDIPGAQKALFADLDHDGDLDIFETGSSQNAVFRNNGNMTFSEMGADMGLRGTETEESREALFGDFDDDGDLDLFVVNQNAKNRMYLNARQGSFQAAEMSNELSSPSGSNAAAVGDFKNDGSLDLALASREGTALKLFVNKGKGVFERFDGPGSDFGNLEQVDVKDLEFIDFDNDGRLDILVAGENKDKEERGIFLYHNQGEQGFADLSQLLPQEPRSARQVSLFDYNEDGDTDILVSGVSGGIFLLRNDGGNMNHYLNMKLVGLRTGSAKNNYFGIGSKVEMRAGDLYQSAVVTRPEITFGLGNRSKADVIRITWTNGVPQNIVLPDADQALVEEQTLKGSCPFLYTWNGEEFVFVKDITWRSALGMPLGIMGENRLYAFPEASDDYIRIEGELLKPEKGIYSLKITSELWETIYMDRVRLVAMDHPDSVEVFVPEQFTPPPFPGMELHQVVEKIYPSSAVTETGLDVLHLLTAKDDNYVSQFRRGKYQGLTASHDLVVELGPDVDLSDLKLFLRGWIFPTDASINEALSQSGETALIPPSVEVINGNGAWQTAASQVGFPMGKDKTVIVDLSGKVNGSDRRIRIRTNMEIYWDELFFSSGKSDAPVVVTAMEPASADLHYRGFSRMYRKGGRYGPHWFDYGEVSEERKWNDLEGNYTRYGDVRELLEASDNRYVISNAGDEMSVQFSAAELPELKKGWKRDYLIHSVGWVKDGDMNTATGNTVDPLPYHGMESYPPAEGRSYPDDRELQEYNRQFNTRLVGEEQGVEGISSRSIKK